MQNKRGRPALPLHARNNTPVVGLVTKWEAETLAAHCKERDVSVSTYVRLAVLAAMQRDKVLG
jgi:phosphotransferase system HPr-like phosphotransfer protein